MLGWIDDTKTYPKGWVVHSFKAEGRFVKGQRLGLWCMTLKTQISMDGQESWTPHSMSGCSVFAGHTKPLTSNYRKEPDGSWREYASGPTDSTLAAGTLEALSAKVLADAAAGKTDLNVKLVVHNRSLDDLVRGSKIELASSAEPISLTDKRIAIVLSSQTVHELERFTRERQALIEASAGLRGDAAAERAKFIQASDPDRLLLNTLEVVRKYAKEAQPAEDLEGVTDNSFDYALVVDWKSLTRFDQLGKYDSFPIPPKEVVSVTMIRDQMSKETVTPLIGELMSGFLISRDLKAVKEFSADTIPVFKPQPDIGLPTGDQAYFTWLASYFELKWGNHGDYDALRSVYRLDYFLKHLDDNSSSTQ